MSTGQRIDIRALLLLALDEKPPQNLPDRVMARVAALTTMLEFTRLISQAPLDWIGHRDQERNDTDDEGDGSTGHD